MMRRLRECRVFPPRSSLGAASAKSTVAPAWPGGNGGAQGRQAASNDKDIFPLLRNHRLR